MTDEMTDGELDSYLAQEIMGWEKQDRLMPVWWMKDGESTERINSWSPTTSLDDMALVEAELKERGLMGEYVSELAYIRMGVRNWNPAMGDPLQFSLNLAKAPSRTRARAAAEVIPDEEKEQRAGR